jgi:hypothetical protein
MTPFEKPAAGPELLRDILLLGCGLIGIFGLFTAVFVASGNDWLLLAAGAGIGLLGCLAKPLWVALRWLLVIGGAAIALLGLYGLVAIGG